MVQRCPNPKTHQSSRQGRRMKSTPRERSSHEHALLNNSIGKRVVSLRAWERPGCIVASYFAIPFTPVFCIGRSRSFLSCRCFQDLPFTRPGCFAGLLRSSAAARERARCIHGSASFLKSSFSFNSSIGLHRWPGPQADRRWLRRIKEYATNEEKLEAEDVGFFNGGQKLYFWAIAISGVLFLITGLLIWFDDAVARWVVAVSYVLHDIAASGHAGRSHHSYL